MGGFFSTLLPWAEQVEAEHYIHDFGPSMLAKQLPGETPKRWPFRGYISDQISAISSWIQSEMGGFFSTLVPWAQVEAEEEVFIFHSGPCTIPEYAAFEQNQKITNLYTEVQNVGCSSTNVVTNPRSGYGRKKSDVELPCMTFLDRMNGLPSKDEWIEQKGSACVLGKLGRRTFHKLFEMVSLLHAGNKSLNGKFTYGNIIYVTSADCYMIDRCPLVDFTPGGYKKDIKALGKVLTKVCTMKMESSQENIAYVAHLLRTMEDMPTGAESSDTFKAFLRNHPCMMSAASRQGLVLEVHRHIKVQPKDLQDKMNSVLKLDYGWGHIATCVTAFKKVYTYLWGPSYSNKEESWFLFCRNFLSHPQGCQSVEYADSAIWCNFDEHLADFLCRLSCTHEFKINVFDKDDFCTHRTEVKATTQSWPKPRRPRIRGRKHSEAQLLYASKT